MRALTARRIQVPLQDFSSCSIYTQLNDVAKLADTALWNTRRQQHNALTLSLVR
jgi:hypothetical protein